MCEGDILLISPRVHTRTFKQGKFMKCIDIESGEVKMLHENCVAGFTTQPEKTRMSLKDFWGQKYCPPPLKVVMTHSLPHVVLPQNALVTLLAEEWEESVIATHIQDFEQISQSAEANGTQTIRILKDIGISVKPAEGNGSKDLSSLHQETYQLYNEFDLVYINQHLFSDDPVWPNFEEVQSMFYKSVTKDSFQDYSIKKPENLLKSIKRQKSVKNSPSLSRRRRLSSTEQINAIGTDVKSDYSPVTLKNDSIPENSVYGTVDNTQVN